MGGKASVEHERQSRDGVNSCSRVKRRGRHFCREWEEVNQEYVEKLLVSFDIPAQLVCHDLSGLLICESIMESIS